MASGTSRSNVQNVTTYGSSDRSHAGTFSSFLMPSLPSASLLLHSFQHIPDIRVLSAVEFKYRDTAHAELLRKRDFLRNRGGVRPIDEIECEVRIVGIGVHTRGGRGEQFGGAGHGRT